MKCLDSRRLTGPNLLWEKAGAVLDIRFDEAQPDVLIDTWKQQAERMLSAVGWGGEQTCVRRFASGGSFAISAPWDALYAATDINDWAWEASCQILLDHQPEPDLEPAASRLREAIEADSNPRLLALRAAAVKRGLACLVDTEALSIGLGTGSRTWSLDALPALEAVPWSALHNIPIGLVTGTNGKTTSVRLAASIGRAAKHTVGISSTDWISVGGEILDRGDYAGPGGARTVLRDRRTDLAVLETARGGLLRRGLALEWVDAALITNVASDHLGEFGVEDVDELADVKWIVARALGASGRLVLNADDPLLLKRGIESGLNITWFSEQPDNPTTRSQAQNGGKACTVRDGKIVYEAGGVRHALVAVEDVPITLGGAARHNVSNALGVAALAAELGLPFPAITEGLRTTRREDNPGRGNLYQVNGAKIIVDFAHNPHGMLAFIDLARRLGAERRLLVIGQAGDRSDQDIRELVQATTRVDFQRVIIKRMAAYNRGRPDGEVARIIYDELIELGMPAQCVSVQEHELDAVKEAISWAQPGDLVVLLIHEHRARVLDLLSELSD